MTDILPTVGYQVAFQATPSHATVPANEGFGDTDPPAWTDITDRVHHPAILRFGRGRSYEHGQIQPGTAEFTVDNTDGAFAPGNMLSPFHPWVIPGRRVRATATWQGLTYPLFDCYVDSWGEAWPTRFAEWNLAQVACTDRLKQLGRHRFQSALVEETIHGSPAIIGYWPLTESVDRRTRFGDNGLGFRPTGILQDPFEFEISGSGSAFSEEALALVGAEGQSAPVITQVQDGRIILATQLVHIPVDDWSLSFWMSKFTGDLTGALVHILDNIVDNGVVLVSALSAASADAGQIQVVVNNGLTELLSGVRVDNGAPHHVVVTTQINVGNDVVTLYVDGVQRDQATVPIPTPSGRVVLGVFESLSSGGVSHYSGQIGHLVLYDSVIGIQRVEAIHERGTRGLLTGEPANTADGENTSVRALFLVNRWVDELPAEIGLDDIIAPSDAGRVSVGHQGLLGRTAADLLAELGTAADGVNFIGPDGGLRTYSADRRRRVPPKFTIDLTIDEIHGLDFYSDDQLLVNDLDYTGTDGAIGNVQNLTSIERFGRVRGQPLNLPLNTASEAKRRAQAVVDRLGQPRPRTQTIQIDLRANPRLIHALLAVDLFDRFDMTNLPDNAPAPTMAWLVEHLEHQVTDQSWLVAIQASPYDIELAAEDLMQVFTSSGTYTKPAGLVAARTRLAGGGGSGGGAEATAAGQSSFGDGGGAGGFSEKIIVASAIGATETVTVGAGGAGASGAVGTAGGTSSFGTHAQATGGGAGGIRPATASVHSVTQSSVSRTGGTGSLGDVNGTGGSGGSGNIVLVGNVIGVRGGDGGASVFGSGPPGSAGGNAGATSTSRGSGGSGAANHASQAALAGGGGVAGVVVVENNFGSGFE